VGWYRSRLFQGLIPICWLAGLVAGFDALERYRAAPGAVGATPEHAPSTAASVAPGSKSRLRMFIHPHCPCTRASLAELGKLAAVRHDGVDIEVLLVKPPGVPADWEQTRRASLAVEFPGVRVSCDVDGRDARRFGAMTSGHVVLYDDHNRLVFSGGITSRRGHEGDNAGRQSIAGFLNGRRTAITATPVYGCPLFATSDCPQSAESAGPTPTQNIGGQHPRSSR
jgi:hypothetical protein